jgi:hypothetical protein
MVEIKNSNSFRISAYATEVKAPDLEFKEKLKDIMREKEHESK